MDDTCESVQPIWPAAGSTLGERGRHVAQIAARLREAIQSGAYVKGDQLPAERELAKRFNTVRSTIRKVLFRLEAEGLIERRVGNGTFVKFEDMSIGDAQDIVSKVSPLELLEARLAVEPHMVRLAVLNATPNEIRMLGWIFDELERCRNDNEAVSRHDKMFHAWLARNSKNSLLVHLYQQINAVRDHNQWDDVKKKILLPDEIDEYNRLHYALYQAIRSRDVASAVEQIGGHLEKSVAGPDRYFSLGRIARCRRMEGPVLQNGPSKLLKDSWRVCA